MRKAFISILFLTLLFHPNNHINAQAIDTLTARQYLILADSLFKERKFENAAQESAKAIQIYKSILGNNHMLTSEALALTGHAYIKMRLYKKAFPYVQEALDIREKNKATQSDEYTSVLNLMAVCQYSRGFKKESLVNFEKALQSAKAIYGEINESVAKYYNNIAVVYERNSDYERALEYFEHTKKVRTQLFDETHRSVIKTNTSIAYCYEALGYLEKSIKMLRSALATNIQTYGPTDWQTGYIYVKLGEVLNQANYTDEAIDALHKSIDISLLEYKEDDVSFCMIYTPLGNSYLKKGDYKSALNYFTKSLDISTKEYGKHKLVINNLYFLGKLYSQKGDNEKGLTYFKKSLVMAEEYYKDEDNPFIGLAHYYIASSYFEQKKFDLTLHHCAEGLSQLKFDAAQEKPFQNVLDPSYALDIFSLKISALNQLSLQEKNSDYLAEASQSADVGLELLTHFLSSYKGDMTKQDLISRNYSFFENTITLYNDLYNQTKEVSYLEKAFAVVEKGKSALLLQSMKNEDAKSFAGLPEQLLNDEKELRANLAFYEKQYFEETAKKEKGDQDLINHFSKKIFETSESYEALVKRFEQEYPTYHQLKYVDEQIESSQVQKELLTDNQSIISYFLTENKLFSFVLTKEELKMVSLDSSPELKTQISQFRKYINDYQEKENKEGLDEAYTQLAYELYQKLIYPVKDYLKKECIIIPHDALGFLPFDALLQSLPEKAYAYRSHEYLLNDYQISYCYSISLLEEMHHKKNKQSTKQLLAFAPEFPANQDITYARTRSLGQLKDNVPEVNAINEIVKGDLFINAAATEERFIQLAEDYSIVHLATHGKANVEKGDYSYLAFTEQVDSIENELLYAKELYPLQLSADMIVLSACETGTGELQKGEGVISLARGFSYAGAKSIITTLWKINDATTPTLMKSFYNNLKNKEAKDAALRKAKLAYISDSRHEMAHPVYWAAFIPLGNMNPITFQNSNYKMLYTGLGLFLFMGGIALWRLKK